MSSVKICDVCDERLGRDDRTHDLSITFPNGPARDAVLEFRDLCRSCTQRIRNVLEEMRARKGRP